MHVTTVSERSPSEKACTLSDFHYVTLWKRHSYGHEEKTRGCQGWGEEGITRKKTGVPRAVRLLRMTL